MPYRWHILAVFAGLTGVVMLFFTLTVTREAGIKRDETAAAAAVDLTEPQVTFVDPSRGPAEASVTVVVFGDYECTSCAVTMQSLEEVRRGNPENIRIVWKDLPNTQQHFQALDAALAARCAGDQGKFWEYHDALVPNAERLSAAFFSATAERLALDISRWQSCLENKDHLAILEKTVEEATALDITGLPAVFISSDRIIGELAPEAAQAFVAQHMNP